MPERQTTSSAELPLIEHTKEARSNIFLLEERAIIEAAWDALAIFRTEHPQATRDELDNEIKILTAGLKQPERSQLIIKLERRLDLDLTRIDTEKRLKGVFLHQNSEMEEKIETIWKALSDFILKNKQVTDKEIGTELRRLILETPGISRNYALEKLLRRWEGRSEEISKFN